MLPFLWSSQANVAVSELIRWGHRYGLNHTFHTLLSSSENIYVIADGIHSNILHLDILAMSLRSQILLFILLIVFITLGRYFEWKIDKNLRSVFVLTNSLSASENPFCYDSRRLRRPQVKDQKLRNESLQREFNINLVSYRYRVTRKVGKKLPADSLFHHPTLVVGNYRSSPLAVKAVGKKSKGGL